MIFSLYTGYVLEQGDMKLWDVELSLGKVPLVIMHVACESEVHTAIHQHILQSELEVRREIHAILVAVGAVEWSVEVSNHPRGDGSVHCIQLPLQPSELLVTHFRSVNR